jgi:hypothetical protein
MYNVFIQYVIAFSNWGSHVQQRQEVESSGKPSEAA